VFFSAAHQPHPEGGRIERDPLKDPLPEEARLSIGVPELAVLAHPPIVTGFLTRRKSLFP